MTMNREHEHYYYKYMSCSSLTSHLTWWPPLLLCLTQAWRRYDPPSSYDHDDYQSIAHLRRGIVHRPASKTSRITTAAIWTSQPVTYLGTSNITITMSRWLLLWWLLLLLHDDYYYVLLRLDDDMIHPPHMTMMGQLWHGNYDECDNLARGLGIILSE